jgi:hypothetical protein
MDRLDDIAATAAPLLRRVGEVLTAAGAPGGHDVWGELRRVRLMPADAVQAVAALRPSAFDEAVTQLRSGARSCVETAAELPPPGDWAGEAADAYDDLRTRAATHLSGGDESLDERLEATADLAQALADWMAGTRARVAAALATVLTSREALTLAAVPRFPPAPAEIEAAADTAALLLHEIAESYADAADLLHGSADLAAAVPM